MSRIAGILAGSQVIDFIGFFGETGLNQAKGLRFCGGWDNLLIFLAKIRWKRGFLSRIFC
jgi:hypothetical protein